MIDQEVGLEGAVERLQEVREELGISQIVAMWTTAHGRTEVVADDDGWDLFVDGRHVPKGGRP